MYLIWTVIYFQSHDMGAWTMVILFILEGGNMHVSFPKFSITQSIPKNNDLRVPLQVVTADDWDIPNYILDGDNISDDYLNNYKKNSN